MGVVSASPPPFSAISSRAAKSEKRRQRNEAYVLVDD